jgi:hypothetical protein
MSNGDQSRHPAPPVVDVPAKATPTADNAMPPQVWPPAPSEPYQSPTVPTLVAPMSVAIYDAKASLCCRILG